MLVLLMVAGVLWFGVSQVSAWFASMVERQQRVESLDKATAAAVFDECAELLFRKYPGRGADNQGWPVPVAAQGPAVRSLEPAEVHLWEQEVSLGFTKGFGDTVTLRYVADPTVPDRSNDELRRRLGSIEQVVYTGSMRQFR
jgi:hypothetical protein